MTTVRALQAAALDAAGRGWPVFPVRPGGKRPAVPDHDANRCTGTDPRCTQGHQGWQPRATTNPDRIRRGWATTPFNVGIACGPAGLVVLDLDIPKPGEETPPPAWRIDGVGNGEDVLAVLAERAGESFAALFETYTVTTASGGRHLYYTTPPEANLGNTTKTLGWLIDTRARGGYVLAAGSTVAGRSYLVGNDLPAAPLPAWMLQRLSRPAPPPAVPVTIATGPGRRGAYLNAAICREVDRVTNASSGARNHALYRAAVALGQLVAGNALPALEVADLLEHAATAAGHITAGAYSTAEARATIASGLRTGTKRPRTVAA